MSGADLERARKAKERFVAAFGQEAWCRGIGLAPAGSGFAIRLNVDPDTAPPLDQLPREFEGITVEVVPIRGYEPR
jgi:hypothetical protein